jgi:hypothetical protein
MRVPFDEGCKLAAAIPDARFVPLESKNHVLLPDEPAWAVFQDELAGFLEQDRPKQPRAIREAGLTPAEAAILQRASTTVRSPNVLASARRPYATNCQ